MYFQCPSNKLNKKQKIDFIFFEINNFIYNDKFLKLVKIFDTDFVIEKNIIIHLNNLKNFSNNWDYRTIQSKYVKLPNGEKARWLLTNDDFINEHEKIIIDVANELSMIGVTDTQNNDYKYLLVLGGAKETNIIRPMMAKKIVDDKNITNSSIIGLGCDRVFDVSENTDVFKYPTNIKTEYDALKYGLFKVFSDNEEQYLNLKQIYYKNNKVFAISAPSKDTNRRANSFDTFIYFFENLYNTVGRILLISSQIHVPYQSMKFLPFSIKYNVEFDIVGNPYYFFDNNYKHGEPVKYLQELRSTILSCCDFFNEFIYTINN